MTSEIKNCPFCGNQPRLSKEIKLYKMDMGSMPIHDLEIAWNIRCDQCGTQKNSYGRTYYNITEKGELQITQQSYYEEEKANPSDKRKEVIEMWNKRF